MRRRLSDGPTDKFRHQIDVDPDPDGSIRIFAVPDSRLVVDTLRVTVDGVDASVDDVDLEAGTFELSAPDEGQKVFASYYFQWFTDADLTEFLVQATGLLNFDGVTDSGISLALRTPVLSLGCYYAYLKKAAESAVAWSSSASGFSSDTSKEHPNWMDLARQMWEEAQKELTTATSGITITRPAFAFVSYRLPRYVPRS